ncbi:asparagine synthase (glutamine-hydrolyzing) [Alkalibacillus haloalkaliphilus]|uniref:asparagine synthase (glutamine-hydrolyzing) n=1 Tax=Alkalibacillus haloalkaliphilus TaxID=94136 RepID=A0A511W4S2_9BACI|nr:asparagine synthase (glutamine-hydrolyzing) [Alkalibacillus haloalkaliphilus]GEN46075.1 asparagine synthetase B [Alkalibacillus haloalkaliphilus]
MCGLTGWLNWNQTSAEQLPILKEMTETLTHRGTDDQGFFMNSHVAFGHQRLAVIDPEKGKQPMTVKKAGCSYTIAYNGELYNTEDLRNELVKDGFTFNTTCDTEVLVMSYVKWGKECLDRLNGIFAFAIWDDEQEELFIARDRLGVKPMFYSEVNGQLLFASEIKALLKHPNIQPIVDREGLSEVLGLGPSRTPGHGLFKQINELRAGHALSCSTTGVKIWRYWNLKSEEHTDSFDETVEKVRFLFKDAVERQLVSDVPLSTFLSGGIDSSAITAIASNYYKENGKGILPTFSVDYKGNDQYFEKSKFQPNSDADFKSLIVDRFKTNHEDLFISEEDLAGYLKEAVLLRDQPGMADVDSSLLWFCKQVKNETTVSLSGECADEIFGGYPWFQDDFNQDGEGFPWIRSLQLREDLLNSKWKNRLNIQDYAMERYKQTVNETPLLTGEAPKEQKRREMFYVNMQWFMAQLLDRKDRMSMGATLEVRVPFADHHLVEYVWNVPWEMKQADGYEKGLLRKALEGYLPEEVLYRKKSPYPKTFQPKYTSLVVSMMEEVLSKQDAPLFELLDKNKVEQLVHTQGEEFKEPWYGQLMTGPQLLAHLWQINAWLEHYNVQIEA